MLYFFGLFSLVFMSFCFFFFFNDTATTEIYTLSLHDALPICRRERGGSGCARSGRSRPSRIRRSEEHTSELQSLRHLVCRLLLEKKKKFYSPPHVQENATYDPFALHMDDSASLKALYLDAEHDDFFFNDTATTEIYTLSLHDALPI